jgi:hypothetical protein
MADRVDRDAVAELSRSVICAMTDRERIVVAAVGAP